MSTRTAAPNALLDALAAGELAGFSNIPPRWGLIAGADIDRQVCAEATCETCGHVGLWYRPYTDPESRRYRAFAECPGCGATVEF